MTLLDFLRRVLPDSGPYFHSRILINGDWRDRRANDFEALGRMLTAATSHGEDSYFATSSYKPRGGRTADNVVSKRVWYIDIDCNPAAKKNKDDVQYASKKEGALAIKEAIRAGLPRPIGITDTGNGFHLYYITDEVVAPTQWRALAKALVRYCEAVGLRIDSKVSEDITRVLRAPTTLNWKDRTNPLKCEVKVFQDENYTLAEWVELMQPFLAGPAALPSQTPPVNPDEPSDLEQGMEGKIASAALMVPQCPLMSHMLDHAGATEAGVIWHKVIHTLAYCEDGDQFHHPMSSGHPSYDFDDTEKQFRRALRLKDRMGPTSCEKLKDASDDSHCSTCRFNGRIKTPLVLGFREWSDFPAGWKSEGGSLWHWDGEEWQFASSQEFKACEVARVDGELMVRLTIDGEVVEARHDFANDTRRMLDTLSPYGILLQSYEIPSVRTFLVSWVSQLRKGRQMADTVGKFGWCPSGFTVGSMVYADNGTELKAFMKDRGIASVYTPQGNLEPWQRCAQFVVDNNDPSLWCAIASAFAAPLMVFTGQAGSLLALVSQKSGTGKSTALKIAQGVWGNPIRIASINDTPASISHQMGTLNNLPMYWDEIRGKDIAQDFVRMVFRLTEGRERQRLTANITQREAGAWETMMVCASNEGILGHIKAHAGASDAGALRVLELEVPNLTGDMDLAVSRMFREMKDNYGHAGVVYAKWLAANKDTASKYVGYFEDKLGQLLNPAYHERFWISTAAALLAGSQIVNKLNLLKINVKELAVYLVQRIKGMRVEVQAQFKVGDDLAINTLARFMKANIEHAVWSESLPGRGRAHGNPDAPAQRGAPFYRIGRKDHKLAVSTGDFEEWVHRTLPGINALDLEKRLVDNGAKRSQCTLEAGTYRSGQREAVLVLDLQNPLFSHLSSVRSDAPSEPDSSTKPPPL